MKNYKTPELKLIAIANVGDVLTYSDNGRLGEIGENVYEDGQLWL